MSSKIPNHLHVDKKRTLPKKTKVTKAGRRLQKSASAEALDLLHGLMGESHRVLQECLEPVAEVVIVDPLLGEPMLKPDGSPVTRKIGGDSRVAMWLMDRLAPAHESIVPEVLDADLSTMQGVIEAAENAIRWVMQGQISIEKGDKLLFLLLKYAQMRAFDQIDELRKLISQYEKQGDPTLRDDSGAIVPKWGRLAATAPANTKPAE